MFCLMVYLILSVMDRCTGAPSKIKSYKVRKQMLILPYVFKAHLLPKSFNTFLTNNCMYLLTIISQKLDYLLS